LTLTFVSGRSAQENSISELKTSFAFDHIPTNTYQANSAYMQMPKENQPASLKIWSGKRSDSSS
jgi:hypothetical protein